MSRHVAVALLATLTACGGSRGGGGGGTGVEPAPWETGSYDPSWKNIAPTTTISFTYNGGQTPLQNGAALAAAILALQPGQRLEIGNGTYSINLWFDIVLQGTSAAPIWIVAAAGATPVLTRPDAAQNVVNIGSGGLTRYLCLRGLTITGGSDLLKLYQVSNVWIDGCTLHDGGGVGIAANSADTDHLHITRNTIHRPNSGTAATGECMYLGANHSLHRMTRSVVALNHCFDTSGASQGDGIEVKQGSHTNWIAENHVHDTNYPCLLVYGTDGLGINLVERNDLHDSGDNTLQVHGEAVVRNNLIMDGATGFASTDHQGSTVNLTFVHNTIVNVGRGANLSSWNGRAGMVFANNAVYSQTSESIRFPSGSSGVTLAGNVVLGGVVGASGGYTAGTGLTDFTDVTWDATHRNAQPSAASPLIGAGAAAHAVEEDYTGAARTLPVDAGAYEKN